MTVKKVNERPQKRAKWFRILSEFANSDAEVVELIPAPGEYANNRSLQASCLVAIKRYKFGLDCILQGNRVFLVKPASGKVDQ